MTTLSNTAVSILTSVFNGHATSKDVAAALDLKVTAVTGSLAGLRAKDLIAIDKGVLSVTENGMKFITVPTAVVEYAAAPAVRVKGKKGDRKAAAIEIIKRLGVDATRKIIITALMNELNMSPAQASTYHYAIVGRYGMWSVS